MIRAAFLAAAVAAPALAASAPDWDAVQRIDQDVRLSSVSERLRADRRTGPIAFTHVAVVDPVGGAVAPDQTVVVRGSQIAWTGPSADAPSLRGVYIVKGAGRFLSPGLVDAHVHTQGAGEHILRLAAGVTTVRDMDGFPWLLRLREAIDADRMIGAREIVAGTIISDQPLDGYAVVALTSAQLRDTVRKQKACGYSAIKVHNSLALWRFDVVAEEARRQGMDLVGHVPHFISVDHAVHHAGMRTLEHYKGFLFDQNLRPSPEDFGEALSGSLDHTWITPTFYTQRAYARGDEAAALLADPRLRYVPRPVREGWTSLVGEAGSPDDKLGRTFLDTQGQVTARLLPLKPRWLAGTDAAGYAFNIAGFALHDEMSLMAGFGIPAIEVLRAATSEPAAAMHLDRDFGQVKAGMRADLILLDHNPVEDVGAYRVNRGVMANGRWYTPEALGRALNALSTVYAEPQMDSMTSAQVRALVAKVSTLDRNGVVFESQALIAAAETLNAAGLAKEAALLTKVAAVPDAGPCAAVYPR